MKIFAVSLPLTIILAACVSYSPAPLVGFESTGILAAPVAAVLSQKAAAIDRPYLHPVTIDLSAPLSPNDVAIVAVLSNPDLEAMRARAGVADAQAFAAGLLPDPTFSFGIDHLLSGPDPVDNLAAGLGFDLNALRARSTLRDQAKAQAKQVRLDLAWAEWQTAGNARLQAARILALRQALDIAMTSDGAAQSLLARYLRASGRGDLPADQVQSTRLAALDAVTARQTVQTGLTAAEYELRRLLGVPPNYALDLAAQVSPSSAKTSQQLFALAVSTRSDLQALRAGYDAQEASVRKAVLDQFPTLDLTITGTRDTGANRLLGPSIGFTLPLWNRNRGGIAIEQATRAALRAEYDARVFQTRADIAAAVAGLSVARSQRATLLDGLPQVVEFAKATRAASARGDLATVVAETAEQTVRDRRLLVVQTDQAIAEQTIALELLVGAPQESWSK